MNLRTFSSMSDTTKPTFFHINPLEMLAFLLAFVIFTPIGTVSHEYGHVLAAQMRGYETKLHYASTDWNAEADKKKLEVLYLENEEDILAGRPFADKNEMEAIVKKLKNDSLFNTLGGPIQTMLTGTIGLVFLFFRRKSIAQNGLKLIDWLGVFLALFWLREVFNIYSSVSDKIFGIGQSFYGGDEARISTMLGFSPGVIPIICGLLGLCVFIYVLFKIIPLQKRLSFIIGGLLGGLLGLYLWLQWLGPIVLP